MSESNDPGDRPYTCADYRAEMMLLGLIRRLSSTSLSEGERESVLREIDRLQAELGMG